MNLCTLGEIQTVRKSIDFYERYRQTQKGSILLGENRNIIKESTIVKFKWVGRIHERKPTL